MELLVAGVLWFAIHPGIAGSPLRAALVRRIGEVGFRNLFSVLSLLSLAFLIWSYSRATFTPLWAASPALRHPSLIVVPIAFVLLAGAFTVPNPTVVGGERMLAAPEPARGMLRITRHPFLWAVALWALAHLLANGDLASLVFFGSMLLTAVVGTFDIDRKRAQSAPEAWAKYAAVTSNLPFAAIVTGRNRLVLRELWLPLAIGLAAAAVMIHFHERWFGVSPLP